MHSKKYIKALDKLSQHLKKSYFYGKKLHNVAASVLLVGVGTIKRTIVSPMFMIHMIVARYGKRKQPNFYKIVAMLSRGGKNNVMYEHHSMLINVLFLEIIILNSE